jgi:hypothetical protein
MQSLYIEWLQRQGVPLFSAGNIFWRLYQGSLVTAQLDPHFISLSAKEAKDLLRKSGALFVRFSSDPCTQETEWWYVICDIYDSGRLSAKTRQNIKRGNRDCSVKKIDGEWLADYGYSCYLAAFNRYQNATPDSKDIFRNTILSTLEGPFEYWGVFYGEYLAGYCQCIVECTDVITNVTKYNPAFLRNRTAYALVSNLINHYVVEKGMALSNSNRSIAHDTKYQDVLISMGFRKQYCRLNVVYKQWLEFAIRAFFPLRKFIQYLPDRGYIHNVKSLLFQEELRRSFLF